MPELPEVEIVRKGLERKLIGQTIVSAEVLRQDSIGYPDPKQFSSLVKGKTFVATGRRGKYLLLYLEQKGKGKGRKIEPAILLVHLRMSGRLLIVDKDDSVKPLSKFLRLQFFLESGKRLCFEDMRVFGRISYFDSTEQIGQIIPSFGKLGPEPLDELGESQLISLLGHKRRPIKSVLLDQEIIAGIGNIYADEILFLSGIHPLRRADTLCVDEIKAMQKIIPLVLKTAIARGGSSVKDFVDSAGVNGKYQHQAMVYGRSAKPCRKCKTLIERIKISGRSSHFCPVCQKHSSKIRPKENRKKRLKK